MFKQILSKFLRDTADKIDTDMITCTDEDAFDAIRAMEAFDSASKMSKDQACDYLHMSRSTFDANVRCGLLPKGLKVKGFKEKFWTKSELMKYEYDLKLA